MRGSDEGADRRDRSCRARGPSRRPGFGLATPTFVVVSSMIGTERPNDLGLYGILYRQQPDHAGPVGAGGRRRDLRGAVAGRTVGGPAPLGGRLRLPLRGLRASGGVPLGVGLVPDRLRRPDRSHVLGGGEVCPRPGSARPADRRPGPAAARQHRHRGAGRRPLPRPQGDRTRPGGHDGRQVRHPGGDRRGGAGRRLGPLGEPARGVAADPGPAGLLGLVARLHLLRLYRLERGLLPGGRDRAAAATSPRRDPPRHGARHGPLPRPEHGVCPRRVARRPEADRRRPGQQTGARRPRPDRPDHGPGHGPAACPTPCRSRSAC